MNTNLTARHCEISEALRERAATRAHRLLRYEERIGGIDIIFENDGGGQRVEALVRVDGSEPVVAQFTGDSFRGALDRVMDRVARQLKRRRDRRRVHAPAPAPEL